VTQKALQDFLRKLEQRKPRIVRGAYLTAFKTGPISGDRAWVEARYRDKNGKEAVFKKSWSAEELYGHVSAGRQPRLRKGPCRVAGELIREILAARGVVR
jgi:hypothetical protein